MSLDATNPGVKAFGQQVLVLQCGGALGAYQAGAYQPID
jgi:predicted acylesterase/phospholipase RssA